MAVNRAIRYVAEPSQVREVSLLGTADLAFWDSRLQKENLRPLQRGGRAQILIIAAEMTYLGIRFTEVSFSVLVFVPEYETQDSAFLVHAFNSCRLFAFCESSFFATPYSHANCHVSVSDCASIEITLRGKHFFGAKMLLDAPGFHRKPSCAGLNGWEGPIFLPRRPRDLEGDTRLFFGRIKGHTLTYPFASGADCVSIAPSGDSRILQSLLDSEFTGEEWRVRPDATHGKSRTYRRSEVIGPNSKSACLKKVLPIVYGLS